MEISIDPQPTDLEAFHKVLRDGTSVRINKLNVDLFEKLFALPDAYKIELFNISPEAMREFITYDDKNAQEDFRKFLKRKWKWRETGDKVEEDDFFDIGQLGLTRNSMKKMIASNKKYPAKLLREIIELIKQEIMPDYDN